MPLKLYTGDRLPIGSVGPRQVRDRPATRAASPPIPVDRYCRNILAPEAGLINRLSEATIQAIMDNSKEVFSWGRQVSNITDTHRNWRFAFRTGPRTHSLFVVLLESPVAGGTTSNAYVTVTIYTDTAEAVATGSADFVYGPSSSTSSLSVVHAKILTNMIQDISPNTEYYGKLSITNGGTPLGVSVFDVQSMTEHVGYLPMNITAQSSVLDVYRSNLIGYQNDLWRYAGAKVLSWTVTDGVAPITTASATSTNIIDLTSGAPSANTPGFTLDMTGKARVSQTSGVPCVIKAFAKVAAGTGGRIDLVDSTNTSIANIVDWGTTAGWRSTTVNLPASAAKYDLRFSEPGADTTMSLYAVSMYEYG